jgi:proteasome lid subunit RPN8/RPN11
MNLDLKVLNALAQDENKGNLQDPNKLYITQGTLAKMFAYAKLVTKMAGSGCECYGYLLKESDALDDTITNAMFAPFQDGSAAYVRVNEEGVKRAIEDAEASGYDIVGWWHSHGTMRTFHSGTDYRNFIKIANGVAPRTMFRTEVAQYLFDEDKLLVDHYKIAGVKPKEGERVKILKKVQRDPWAASIVVNVMGEKYVEKRTKTYCAASNTYKMNEPINPEVVEVPVEDDVRFDIPDLEWEIKEKLTINHGHNGGSSGPYDCSQYKLIARRFLKSANEYVRKGGKYSISLANMIEGNMYEELRDAEEGRKSIEYGQDALDSIETFLGRQEWKKLKDSKLSRFQLEHKILIDTMLNFIKASMDYKAEELTAAQNNIIEAGALNALRLQEAADRAAGATKSLVRYAMEPITDYKGIQEHKYRMLISNTLQRVRQGSTLSESLRKETSKSPTLVLKNELILYPDRMAIYDQLVRDMYFERLDDSQLAFLDGFAANYIENHEALDPLIENHLLAGSGKPDAWYQDAALIGRSEAERTLERKARKALAPKPLKRSSYSDEKLLYAVRNEFRETPKILTGRGKPVLVATEEAWNWSAIFRKRNRGRKGGKKR